MAALPSVLAYADGTTFTGSDIQKNPDTSVSQQRGAGKELETDHLVYGLGFQNKKG